MKRQTFIASAIILLISLGFMGCKKDGGAKKDLTPLFKNTIWTGEFSTVGAPTQPMSIEFKEGGTLSWHELSSEGFGTWKLENNELSITLVQGDLKAGVSDDNKLTNVRFAAGNQLASVSAGLNTNADGSLDGTTWTTTDVALHFKAGNLVDMDLGPTGSTKYKDIPYFYQAKTLRYSVANDDYRWFIVKTGVSAYKGVNTFAPDPALHPFEITKN